MHDLMKKTKTWVSTKESEGLWVQMERDRQDGKVPRGDLRFRCGIPQNYKNVISGDGRAPLRSMAGPRTLPGLRPGDFLPREGRVVARGQADLRRLPRPHRVSQLRPSSRRAIWGVGWHERTGTPAPEAYG